MKIGGLQKLTLVDFPGKVAATVFLIGCNFRCPFCQNPDLVDPNSDGRVRSALSDADFFKFLDEKKGLIDGICITGGEPTIHSDLIDFIKKIKSLGFLVKLDTNGSNPEILNKLTNEKLVDFIAMDIKTSVDVKIRNPKSLPRRQTGEIRKYDLAAGTKTDIGKIKQSVEVIRNSGIDYEFRTTAVPEIIGKQDIEKMGEWLKGAKKFALQQFRNQKVLDPKFKKLQSYPEQTLKEFQKILEKYIERVELRI